MKGKEFSLCRIDREEVVGLFTSINLKDVWVFHLMDQSAAATYHTHQTTMAHYTHAECERLIRIALGMPEKKIEIVSVLPWDSAMSVMDNFSPPGRRIFFAGKQKHTKKKKK